jgi:2-polyprenyl-6-methoxyphenol hydroxylase-like FAD-dependent oxidoreductase
MTRRAIVVGGGIGGLASAIALTGAGWEVEVFERRDSFSEIGAGLTLWPNALKALDALGVGDEARAAALTHFDGGFMTRSRRWLTRLNTDDIARWGDAVVLARPDLLALLLRATPRECLRPGTAVQSVTRDGIVTTSEGRHTADLVVGADGLWSTVRRQLWPDARAPRYSGYTCWRFNTRVLDEPVPDGAWSWAPDLSLGYTPLPGGRAYVYALERTDEGGEGNDLSMFRDWPEPIPRLLDNVKPEDILRHDVYEGPLLRSYVEGRAVLLGDAAHALHPSLGQGACQALEDAVTLAAVDGDLARYDRERRRRTQRVVRTSRVVMHAAHVRPPWSWLRNLSFMAVPRALNLQLVKLDYAWTPPALPRSPARR